MSKEVLEDMLGGNGSQAALVDGKSLVHRSRHRRHTSSITPEGEMEKARTWYGGDLVKYALDLMDGMGMDVSDAEGLTKADLVVYINNHMKQIKDIAYDKEEQGKVTKDGRDMIIKRFESIREEAAKGKKSTPTYGFESVSGERRQDPNGHGIL